MEMKESDLMDGNLFYFFIWIVWVIVTFILGKNNPIRTPLAIGSMLVIILSPYSFQWNGVQISILLIVVLFSLFLYLTKWKFKQLIYLFLASYIVMVLYASVLLISMLDPIILLIDRTFLVIFFLFISALLLHQNIIKQLLLVSFGSINGEIVCGYILNQYEMKYTIGSMEFLDISIGTIAALSGVYILKSYLAKWENYIYTLEKEKHKVS